MKIGVVLHLFKGEDGWMHSQLKIYVSCPPHFMMQKTPTSRSLTGNPPSIPGQLKSKNKPPQVVLSTIPAILRRAMGLPMIASPDLWFVPGVLHQLGQGVVSSGLLLNMKRFNSCTNHCIYVTPPVAKVTFPDLPPCGLSWDLHFTSETF